MTPLVQLPPLAVIKERIRTSINAGVLQCQQPGFKPNKGCSYIGPCAIGVLLTPEQRIALELYGKEYHEETSIQNLISLAVVKPHHDTRRSLLENIQLAHDNGDLERLKELIQ